MKNFSILSLILILSYSIQAQDRFKSTKNIYVLDVTLSMWGKSAGAKDIFDDVRSELIKVINSTNNENTEIVVVTFQDEIIDTWSVNATDAGKREIIDKLNEINAGNVPKQNTNIHGSWKKGRSLIDPKKLNVVFLLTDGEHSVAHTPKSTLYKEVASWGEFATGKDYYAFLVELTEQAKDDKLREIVQKTEQAQIISGIEFFVLSVEDKSPVLNTHDELSFNLNLIGDRSAAIPKDFTYDIFLDDPNFEILNNTPRKLSDGSTKIQLRSLKPIDQIQEELDQVSSLEFHLRYDEERFPQVKLLNRSILCSVKNKKEKVLFIEVLEESSDR